MLSAGIHLCSSVLVISFLTSLSPAFDLLLLNQHQCSVSPPFSRSVQYQSSYSAAVIPHRQPCPPPGIAPCHAHAKNSLVPSLGAEQYSCPSDLPPESLISIYIPLTCTQPLFLPSFDLAQITV